MSDLTGELHAHICVELQLHTKQNVHTIQNVPLDRELPDCLLSYYLDQA